MMRRSLVIILALILDLALGDPPNRWHPVAWMGRGVAWAQRRAPGPKAPRGRAFAY
ncbi:MAG TPA: hypothetical protein EYP25_01750, partial [Anaerolineae bacterium]|nr:hypothetical protein [Anaerolineae bacterium]